MLILVDQDGVLADFPQGFVDAWRRHGDPAIPAVPVAACTSYELVDEYPACVADRVVSLYHAEGFYRNLAPVEGAIEAVHAMEADGHEVFICTTPADTPYCAAEKYEWIERYLGREYRARTILAKDKTLVAAEVLIDDKPNITGAREPLWRHVLYDQPYNRAVCGPRLTWRNWREVLSQLALGPEMLRATA